MWKPEHEKQTFTAGVTDLSTVTCPDLNAIRFFYGELLGLEEKIWKENAYSVFQLGQTEVMFCQNTPAQFAAAGGHDYLDIPCLWSVRVPEALFLGLLYRVKQNQALSLKEKPQWRHNSYWGVTVLDPVGNPIELFTVPHQEPLNKDWESSTLLTGL
jgi:extradiol dioxygenase family protein